MYKILTKSNMKDSKKLKKLMAKYYLVVKDEFSPDSFIDAMTDNMFVFLLDDSYAICERTFNTVTNKSYFIIWNIYAPKKGKALFQIVEKEAKKQGVSVVGFWSTEPEKFAKLVGHNKTGIRQTMGFFEKEVK